MSTASHHFLSDGNVVPTSSSEPFEKRPKWIRGRCCAWSCTACFGWCTIKLPGCCTQPTYCPLCPCLAEDSVALMGHPAMEQSAGFAPANITALQSQITEVKSSGRVIRVVGTGHSFSNVDFTDSETCVITADHLKVVENDHQPSCCCCPTEKYRVAKCEKAHLKEKEKLKSALESVVKLTANIRPDADADEKSHRESNVCPRASLDQDPWSYLFVADGGVSLHDLNHALKKLDARRMMPQLGQVDGQTIAGAAGTGTHGSGLKIPPISSFIVSMDLVDADGNHVRVEPFNGISQSAPNGIRLIQDDEVFHAANVSLGQFGVVASVVVFVCDAYKLRERRTFQSWPTLQSHLIYEMPEESIRHVEFMMNPHPLDDKGCLCFSCRCFGSCFSGMFCGSCDLGSNQNKALIIERHLLPHDAEPCCFCFSNRSPVEEAGWMCSECLNGSHAYLPTCCNDCCINMTLCSQDFGNFVGPGSELLLNGAPPDFYIVSSETAVPLYQNRGSAGPNSIQGIMESVRLELVRYKNENGIALNMPLNFRLVGPSRDFMACSYVPDHQMPLHMRVAEEKKNPPPQEVRIIEGFLMCEFIIQPRDRLVTEMTDLIHHMEKFMIEEHGARVHPGKVQSEFGKRHLMNGQHGADRWNALRLRGRPNVLPAGAGVFRHAYEVDHYNAPPEQRMP